VAKSLAPPDPAAILKGLRKAFGGPRPLNGDGEEPLFPKGAAGNKLARAAEEQGLLSVIEEGTGRKKTKKGVLTEKGRNHVLAADDPKPILEALLASVKAITGPQLPVENPVAFRQAENAKTVCVNAIEKAKADSARTVEAALAKQQEAFTRAFEQAKTDSARTVEAALAKQQEAFTKAIGQLEQTLSSALASQAPPQIVDARLTLAALEAALVRVKAPATASPVETGQSQPSVLQDAIVAFLENWAKEKGAGCQFDVMWKYLKERHLHLTIGTFQDTLRTLSDAGRIRLSGWPRMIDDMPQPQLALYVSSKVMYYAHPA
jgi:hypothetical protein